MDEAATLEPNAVDASAPGGDGRARLIRTIQSDIIPRLMLAHACDSLLEVDDDLRRLPPGPDEVEDLARLLILQEPEPARLFVDAVKNRETGLEAVYLDLFTPAARRLGDMWLEDRCSWADVTVGLTRLHQMVRSARTAQGSIDVFPKHGRGVLALAPREQHCLGICILEDFLARKGWDLGLVLSTSRPDCVQVLETECFDVIGFSLSSDDRVDDLKRVIRRVRRVSANPELAVVVGGLTFNENPDLVDFVGADGSARDAAEAVELFERFRSPQRTSSGV